MDFDEIFWRGRAWLKDHVIQFWWRSGSRESKVRNPDPPDRRRFVLCECILVVSQFSIKLNCSSDIHAVRNFCALTHVCIYFYRWGVFGRPY